MSEADNSTAVVAGGDDDKTSAELLLDSYSHFGIHEEMLKDTVRTKTYQNVIYKNTFLFKDKIVLDIECSQMADMAKQIVETNGFSNVITVLKGKVEEIELPVPKVDIIISEWMGYFLLFENMLDTVLYARNKWLVSNDGIVLPDKASLYVTAIEDHEYKEDKLNVWYPLWNDVYGFDMKCIKKQSIMEPLCRHDNGYLEDGFLGDVSFTAPFKLRAERSDYIHALVAYFDVSFTQCHKLMGFSTGPRSRTTHWKQTVLYLEDVLTICEGEVLSGSMTVSQNKKNPRDVDITLKYELNGQRSKISELNITRCVEKRIFSDLSLVSFARIWRNFSHLNCFHPQSLEIIAFLYPFLADEIDSAE
ncbi:hypothetical protein MKX03_008470 [Papaver bracteatum]|nr:hypothetical protein MKX03_008470 [Papaver bracteatum]